MNALLLKLTIFVVSVGAISAQEETPLPNPIDAREKLREWVRTQQLISEEETDWQAEKATLADLNALRKKEIAHLDQIIAAAGSRLTDAVKRKKELLAEEETLRVSRAELESAIERLKADTLQLAKLFPTPLKKKVSSAIANLEDSAEADLQDRYRDLLATLREAVMFQNKFTVDTEMREIAGQSTEVKVLYLGLAQAYYVDRSGLIAGTGKPTAEGWVWTEKSPLAASIQETIAVFEKAAAPKLVQLPLQIDEK